MILVGSLLTTVLLQVPALDRAEPPPRHDALDYAVDIILPDSGRIIEGTTSITWVRRDTTLLVLHLDSSLAVLSIDADSGPLSWRRSGNRMFITAPGQPGDTGSVVVKYRGPVIDGMIIEQRADSRTFFADNWPNRARRWFPSQDHPADKATATFRVVTRSGYRVIANGQLVEREPLSQSHHRWTYRQEQPLPTYSMVVGAAPMTVTNLPEAACDLKCVPQTLWSFLPDSADAVAAFRMVGDIVEYFSGLVAPFPYPTLAHVQSSTIFGGMENATAIFYSDDAYDGGPGERLIAHETAHQWFGDAVTPADWNHLWLSEGFATYFAALWLGQAHGPAAFRQEMERTRNQILSSPASSTPILSDTLPDNLLSLLNSNNYGKGGWTLHMLRGVVGDSSFFSGIRDYYRRYQHGNASSEEFQTAMEAGSGADLDWFFAQALRQPGYPILELSRSYLPQQRKFVLTIRQVQPAQYGVYRLPGLAVEIDGRREAVDIVDRETVIEVDDVAVEPTRVVVDPEGWWLIEVR